MTTQHFPLFVAAGEALTDLIAAAGTRDTWTSKTGGATWNVARVLARLGVPSAFAGAVSSDLFGDALWAASADAGLDLRFLQRKAKAPLLAVVDAGTPPRYFFIGDDSADLHFDPEALPQGWREGAAWVHFGGISLAREPLAGKLVALAESLHAAGVRISYDPNFRNAMDERYYARLRRMVAVASVIKVSDEDVRGLLRTDDAEQGFAHMRAWKPDAMWLYTRGADGASLHVGAEAWHAPAPAIAVVDTVGAGDASMGALLYSLMRDAAAPPRQHLRFAVAAGAATCLTAGATPPTLAAIEACASQNAGA